MVPGPGGAHNWQPMTYSAETGLVYIPAKQEPFVYKLNEEFEPQSIGMNLGINTWDPPGEVIELGPEFGEEHQGYLLAWDPVSQKEVWRVEQKYYENGGLLSTAGNLVFQGNADEEMVAYDAKTGDRLWSMPTQTGVVAPPVTYSIDGEQYIAVVAGWGGVSANTMGVALNPEGTKRNVSRILSFKLGGDARLAPLPDLPAIAVLDDFGLEGQIDSGGRLYTRYCGICHGAFAIGGGALPDLRRSAFTSSAETFQDIVLEGTLLDRGMASFAEVLSSEDTEAIRAYLARQANL
jgi:alcohol dehydrogenase (cytochrome c)/quinohemoprotein ethanol dehydrogenase